MGLLQLIVTIGYTGSFLLLPFVIYTNLKESLYKTGKDNQKNLILNFNDYERNQKSTEILNEIEKNLTRFTDDDGIDYLTIKKGSQARFMKFGLDYINKRLLPNDLEIVNRINEFSSMYKDCTKRVFTGSGWVIVCSIFVGILFAMPIGRTSGSWIFDTFFFTHLSGLIFYIVASRTPDYSFQERIRNYGKYPGLISNLMTTLLLGNGTKHYKRVGDDPWERDWESEAGDTLMYFLLLFIISLLLGFLTAFLGVVNFILNYSTSSILPIESDEKWYKKNFH